MSRYNTSEHYHKQLKKKRRHKGALRVFVVVLLVLVAGVGTAAALWVGDMQERLNSTDVVTEELREALVEPEAPGDPYYVLLMGTDGRDGDAAYRADTIILVRVDPENQKLTLLSIPRDTMVTWKGSTMKINGVHTYSGAAGMVQIVGELCGVEIAHYAEIDFNGLEDLVDILGGVTVDVDVYMYDDENFCDVVELEAGEQTLNGAQALFYCRCRHFTDGDYTRMRHQRTFIKAMVAKITSTYNPATLLSLVNSCVDMVATDLSVSEIVDLASDFIGMDAENDIYTAYATSSPATIDEISYVILDEDALAEIMEVIEAGEDPSYLNDGTYGYYEDDDEDESDDESDAEVDASQASDETE